jgi:hypothetical protein
MEHAPPTERAHESFRHSALVAARDRMGDAGFAVASDFRRELWSNSSSIFDDDWTSAVTMVG